MSIISNLTRFDVDFGLLDAVSNSALHPSKRAVAALCIGVEVDDAYLAIEELLCAVRQVNNNVEGAKDQLSKVLCNSHCDDLQRAVYYALAGRGVKGMTSALEWLAHVLMIRRKGLAWAMRGSVPMIKREAPYVANRPDGILPHFDPNFDLGPSWEAKQDHR